MKMVVSKSISFTDTSRGGNGEVVVAWIWEFFNQDGTTLLATSNEQNPIYSFPNWGQYWVRLTITNSCGAENSTDLLCVSTGCPTPSAIFTHTGDSCV